MSTHRPTDYKIITRALELLRAGISASNIPKQLKDEFGLPLERAKELTNKAIELHKKPGKRGKLDTKPFDELGE